jgi:hypothetical protein
MKKGIEKGLKMASKKQVYKLVMVDAGNTKEGSITVPLTSCLTGSESAE